MRWLQCSRPSRERNLAIEKPGWRRKGAKIAFSARRIGARRYRRVRGKRRIHGGRVRMVLREAGKIPTVQSGREDKKAERSRTRKSRRERRRKGKRQDRRLHDKKQCVRSTAEEPGGRSDEGDGAPASKQTHRQAEKYDCVKGIGKACMDLVHWCWGGIGKRMRIQHEKAHR